MMKRKWLFWFGLAVLLTVVISACSNEEVKEDVVKEENVVVDVDPTRYLDPISILSRPQSAAPDEYETAILIRDALIELGAETEVQTMPWEQLADIVWYERDQWQMTGWQMAARPERLDPDEFTYNLFHSQGMVDGYNFMGYNNPEYDALAEAQRVEVNQDVRADLIKQAQQLIADDAVYHFTVHPDINIVYNKDVFDEGTITDMTGMGARNFWTYVNAEPSGDQTDIILNSADNVQAVNPFYISGSTDSWITELIWDRVMRMNDKGLPEAWAAESVKWVDDTTVSVVLRDGMTFHDGNPVTAEDVKFSFEAPKTGEVPMYQPFVEYIEEIEVLNDLELVFHLSQPWAAFETASLAKLNIVPKHIWEPILTDLQDSPENAESFQEDVPVGSGPYKFDALRFQEEVVLEANEEHFNAPKFDRWIVRIIPNMEAALGMIQNGEINFLATYTGDAELLNTRVEEAGNLEMVTSVDLGFRFFAVNQRLEPFNNLAFRKALQAVIDKQLITQIVWKGFATPADSVIAPTLEFWKNEGIETPTGGIAEARNILSEAGFAWDEDGKLLKPE
ncbi:ABC transporter substrate-binding protein [Paenisporosarcina sp. TG20]|uniref:ABC transporter substrate-binding protein n=1 Tax=Paenisporosarcina sp. TG20 TaxID=1211706 RepID=UPI0002EEC21F|nr:ABC transporter substrate-binding protein [Paenisporosarcina sp. TG20]